MLKNKEELAEHGEWTKCHCTIHLKMVNFTLHEFHINEKKENQKNIPLNYRKEDNTANQT